MHRVGMGDPMKTIALLLLIPAVLSASDKSTTAGKSCVAMRITAGYGRSVSVAVGPVNLVAEVRVQQSDYNRYIIVAWDYAPTKDIALRSSSMSDAASNPSPMNDGRFGQSDEANVEPDAQDGSIGSEERSLMGVSQPTRLEDFKLHRLESGTFLVTATVYTDEDRKRSCGRATARVTVR